MAHKYLATPDVLGYKLGAIPMALSAGTTDVLENVLAAQGQQYSLLRGWSAAALDYATVALTSDGKVMVSGAAGGAGSTDVSIIGAVAVTGPLTDAQLRAAPVPVSISGGSTLVDANLSSVGSTKLVGQVTVANPTTGVTVVPATPGSSMDYIWVRDVSTGGGASGAASTTVDANLTSAGSTRLVGQVTVANPTTGVTVSSGVVLGPSTAAIGLLSSGTQNIGTVGLASDGSTRLVGQVTVANPTTAVTASSGVILGGSTALIGLISSGTQTIGTVINTSGMINGASTALIGLVAQGSGSSGNQWFVASVGYSSGGVARSSVSTTVDIQVIAANASRKALIIANRSTAQTVGIGFSTAVLTTALANVDVFIPPSDFLSFGIQGGLPLYLGPLRGINLTSTTLAGSVGLTEFT